MTLCAEGYEGCTFCNPVDNSERERGHGSVTGSPWDHESIWEWYRTQPFLVGFNYLPRTAVNFVEMWQKDTFDLDTIKQELQWAKEYGYNALRTNIPMIVWECDRQGLTERINKFLEVTKNMEISVMLCPLDDCEFSGEAAHLGKQPEPLPNQHNSRAVGSPGRHIVIDESQWNRVEDYVRYMVKTWGKDDRIIVWDLYNEPGNGWIFDRLCTRRIKDVDKLRAMARKLMEKVFQWAREEHPSQPLTTSCWHVGHEFCHSGDPEEDVGLCHIIDQTAMALSDVVTVHAYCEPDTLRKLLRKARKKGKPVILTEWMARHTGSTFKNVLPILKEMNVGFYHWGLVQGKTQTYVPYPNIERKGDMWFHDVLNDDGTPHINKEMEILIQFVKDVRKIDELSS